MSAKKNVRKICVSGFNASGGKVYSKCVVRHGSLLRADATHCTTQRKFLSLRYFAANLEDALSAVTKRIILFFLGNSKLFRYFIDLFDVLPVSFQF